MEVKRPQEYRVRLAFDHYSVGQMIQPVGLWRDHLMARGFIERVSEAMVAGPEPERVDRPRGKRKHGQGNNHAVESTL